MSAISSRRPVRFRILRDNADAPSPDGNACDFGLQDKDGALLAPARIADGRLAFDFVLEVAPGPDGRPNFTGRFASGPRDQRFVYLSWKRRDGAGYMNRIKIRLADLNWPAIDGAVASGGRIETDASGRATGGGTVPVDWVLRKP